MSQEVAAMVKKILTTGLLLGMMIFADGCRETDGFPSPANPRNVVFAGVRSSIYGIKPFPEPAEWQRAIETMTDYFPGAGPGAIWIVGGFKRPTTCRLMFPTEGISFPNVEFADSDIHERFLSHFDRAGIHVFLQVEPAHADLPTLIDLVLGRYKHHPCVIGFGVDVEWYREADRPGRGVPVDDETARTWEARVKSHNPSYRLFLKHWDFNWMPPAYRGEVVFVDDSQKFKNMEALLDEFQDLWAERFYPNPVYFQVGYNSDKPWWQKLDNPPLEIGRALARRVRQDCGIIWVDFSLRDVFRLSAE